MEGWLAELTMQELQMNTDTPMFMNHPQSQHHHHHQNTTTRMETTPFHEQLAAALAEEFPYPLSSESNTSSPQFDYTHFIEPPFTPPEPYINSSGCDDFRALSSPNVGGSWPIEQPRDDDKDKEDVKKQQQKGVVVSGSGIKKRKREPSQVLDHIMAERKRRELLSQLFIALSAIVPGLKKTDKTSVLGEAIKYMKQLQEKVKVLEEVEAKRTVESVVVVVKKSQLVVDDEAVDDNGSSCTVEDNRLSVGGGGSSSGNGGDVWNETTLPEIEVKVSDKTLLIKVYCERHKGVLPRLFAVLDKYDDMSVASCSIIPFGSLGCDITIVVQKEKGFDKNVRDFIKSLRSAILLPSQVANEHKC